MSERNHIEKLLESIDEKINIIDWQVTGGLKIDDNIEDLRCNLKSLKAMLKVSKCIK